MPALSPDEWAALRGEWEAGTKSNLQLAAKYDVSEKAIRKRAISEGWERSPEALAAAQAAGTMRGILAHDEAKRPPIVPPPREPEPPPKPESDHGSEDAGSESEPPSDPTLKAQRDAIATEVREISIDRVAQIMAEGTRADLDRIDRQAAVFDALHGHIMTLLGMGRGVEMPGERDRMDELLEAMAEGKDTIAPKISAMARLAESIQNQRRKALGMDDRPKKMELSGPDGGPIHQVTREEKALVLDFGKMSTADLQAFQRLTEMLEGNTERPPVPAPPGDPGADAGDEDEAT